MADSKIERGRQFSRQPIFLKGEAHNQSKHNSGHSEEQMSFKKKLSDSDTKNIPKRKHENFQYERPPIYQYHRSVEESEDPEFHSASNIAACRIYLRGLEYCKLMDAHLLENAVVRENRRLALTSI